MEKISKFDTAIGYFWGASLFIGALFSLVYGFKTENWLIAIIVGVGIFLITGLIISGIITLFRKDK